MKKIVLGFYITIIILSVIYCIVAYATPHQYSCKNCNSLNIELKSVDKGISYYQCNDCNQISHYYH